MRCEPRPLPDRSPRSRRGLWLSFGILAAWFATLVALVVSDFDALPPALVALAVPLRAFLQTGLFIVAHDAMHGSLEPGWPRTNDRVGRIALALYAFLPYGPCRSNHLRHHRSPGSRDDPDHHNGSDAGALAWYVRFMGGYLSAGQMGVLLSCWLGCLLLLSLVTTTPVRNLLVFWTLPLLLSSLQLFFFGTYLPHRGRGASPQEPHQPKSLPLPGLLSLLACYHFGYHREHHEHPEVPWFQLPDQTAFLRDETALVKDRIRDPGALALAIATR